MDFHLLTGLFVSFFCPELGLKLPQSTAFDHVCDINEIRQILNRVVEGNFGLSKGSYFQSWQLHLRPEHIGMDKDVVKPNEHISGIRKLENIKRGDEKKLTASQHL